MAWFQCFMHGKNFPGEIIGETGLIGFYAGRYVEAASAEEAETIALEELRKDETLNPPGVLRPANAQVFFEDIEEVDASEVPKMRRGFTFYKVSDE